MTTPEIGHPGAAEHHPRYELTPEHLRPILDEAARTHTDIPDAAARELASLMRLGEHSPLTRFARGEEVRSPELRHNYLEMYHNPDNPAEVRDWAAWIGASLIHRDSPDLHREDRQAPVPDLSQMLCRIEIDIKGSPVQVHVPGDYFPTVRQQGLFHRRIRDNVDAYGPAFIAYVSRGDIDATEPHIATKFADSYVGQFTSTDEALRRITDLNEIERCIEGMRELVGGEAVVVDWERLWRTVDQDYVFVEHGGMWHVFNDHQLTEAGEVVEA